MSDDILTLPPPPADARLAYGTDPNQFGELRLPKDSKGPFPVVLNIHGGFWRAKYDLAHHGHLCAALTAKGSPPGTWNIAAWAITAGDGRARSKTSAVAIVFFPLSRRNTISIQRKCWSWATPPAVSLRFASPAMSLRSNVQFLLAGVVDLPQALDLHLGDNAVSEFLGGTPKDVPEHYHEADPMQLRIAATQWLIHGAADDTVPSYLSRNYTQQKKTHGEDVHYLEISTAAHLDLIDPHSPAWPKVESTVLHLLQ